MERHGLIDAAIEFMSPGEGATLLPEPHILKGDLMAALAGDDRGARSVAESWYRRAFDRAGELDARTGWLQAATRIARLKLADGKREAAASRS